MYTEKDFQAITDIILKDIPSAMEIILFGSYAKNAARDDSDADFLIITSGKYNRQDKLKTLASLRWDIASTGYNADIILKHINDYLIDKKYPTLSRVIEREGKTIWKRN